jgi:hypothetical protein
MTYNGTIQYLKSIGAGAFIFHLFITDMLDIIGGIWVPPLRGISNHPWPVAIPIAAAGGAFGWWLQHKENQRPVQPEPLTGPDEDVATYGA